MFILIFIVLTLIIVIYFLNFLALLVSNKNSINWREEITPFECGFEISSILNIPFSLIYFLLTLIFLLFDLEIIYLIFLGIKQINEILYFNKLIYFIFILFLLLRFLYEWNRGALDWNY